MPIVFFWLRSRHLAQYQILVDEFDPFLCVALYEGRAHAVKYRSHVWLCSLQVELCSHRTSIVVAVVT
jgi:hypothetical protein